MITLELSVDEVNAVLGVLGDLPTKTGAWPLIVKIKEQAESQVEPENAMTDGAAVPYCDGLDYIQGHPDISRKRGRD